MATGLKAWFPDGRVQFDSTGHHGLILDIFTVTDGVPGSKTYDVSGAIIQTASLPMWPTFSGGLTGIPFVAYSQPIANGVAWSWPDWFGKGQGWYIPTQIVVYTRTN